MDEAHSTYRLRRINDLTFIVPDTGPRGGLAHFLGRVNSSILLDLCCVSFGVTSEVAFPAGKDLFPVYFGSRVHVLSPLF